MSKKIQEFDKELITIREFVKFSNDILDNKSSSNMHRLISKPTTLTPAQQTEIKQIFATYFTNVQEWSNFKGKIIYKTGEINMEKLEKKCSSEEDATVFKEYMDTIRAIYFDIRKNLGEFITKLGLEEGSAEASFVSDLFNEIGGDLIDTIKAGADVKDIATLLPRAFEMVKNGKLIECFNKLKGGTVKMSKIVYAFAKLIEDYENSTVVKIEGTASTTASSTDSTQQITSSVIEE